MGEGREPHPWYGSRLRPGRVSDVTMFAWRVIRQETTAHQNRLRAQLARGNRLARAAARRCGAQRHPRLRRRGNTGDNE